MQQYNHQAALHSKANQDYLNVIADSINYFMSTKAHMEERVKAHNQFVSSKNQAGLSTKKQYEPLCINKINYIAILTLEKLGIDTPSQKKIDIMESIILLSMGPGKPTQDKPQVSTCNNTIAGRILQRSLRNSCK